MKKLGLIIPYDYKLLSIAAILDVFETTNRLLREQHCETPFSITVLQTPKQIKAGKTSFHSYTIESIRSDFFADIVLLPSFTTDNMAETVLKNREFISWLRDQYLHGAMIASFCTGAFLLAASGLLNGKLATTHSDACDLFAAMYPSVNLKPEHVVTLDGRIYTSGGSTSTFHLLLRIIQRYCGNETAIRVAKIFAIDMNRNTQTYFATFIPHHNHKDELVKSVQKNIETRYHEIETIEALTKNIPTSRRNLVRRFKLATGVAPIEYLQYVRVEWAKKQLEQTNLNVNQIIERTGYSDPKSFRKVFVKIVGMSPSEYREKFTVS